MHVHVINMFSYICMLVRGLVSMISCMCGKLVEKKKKRRKFSRRLVIVVALPSAVGSPVSNSVRLSWCMASSLIYSPVVRLAASQYG